MMMFISSFITLNLIENEASVEILEVLVRAFKKLFKKLINPRENNPRECNLVEGIYLFLKLSKIQFNFS